ncbi:MAG: N-acetylmuramoyl-L-alanine amidase [Tenericutes bacterium]|nr:N-acetylmuramoyl-L-alanine amidase [Mycoplasmatota bacterium]
MIRKLKIRTILIALITLLIGSLATSYSIVNSDNFLKSFKITNLTNVNTKYHLEYEKTTNATVYEVIIYDESSEIIFNEKTTENVVDFDLNNLRYDEKYKLVIYAYDKNGESISVKNPYEFTYTEPSFSKDNNLVLDDNEDYTLYIDGELNKDNKNYQIGLYDNNILIYKEEIKDNEYIIKQKYFNGLTQTLTVKLFDNDTEINSITLYSNISPISDITIVSPQNNALLDYQDVPLTFTGGDNATEYILEIFKDDILIKEVSLNQNRAIISSEFFVKDNNYTFKIKAKYLDYESYSKEATVSFKMKEKETLLPVYINKDSNYVKENSYITLNNPNSKGTIYYTLDGTDPNETSLIYENPILIKENTTIKTIIKEDKSYDSPVSTYNLNIGNKTDYKVYLSPSNQDGNLGVKSVGYTNEEKEMNDLSNYIEKRLKDYNIKVYRNNPNGNINLWVADSRYYGADLHIAIHSNASTNHTSKGIETWINDQTSDTYSLANMIQSDLMNIYYDKENGNRGVKYSNGALGETRMPKFGILVEVAHHDYLEDAKWIMHNKELIGNTIADSILKYFGII